jgi:hypothetical protein
MYRLDDRGTVGRPVFVEATKMFSFSKLPDQFWCLIFYE